MAASLTRFTCWLWGGKEKKETVSNSSTLNPSSEWGFGRKEREKYDFVLVPSDGGSCLSESEYESDDPDWSVGWLEPLGPQFQKDDESDDSFQVMVPCYRHGRIEVERSNNELFRAIKMPPNQFSSVGNDYMERWLEAYKASVAEALKSNSSEGSKANAAAGSKANSTEGLKANAAEASTANVAEASTANAAEVSTANDGEGSTDKPVPKAPKPPLKNLRSVLLITSAPKKFSNKKTPTKSKTSAPKEVAKSGLSKKEALEEIDKLQKKILTLQTVKEFVKSSYDNAIAKYWDTEEEIKGLQERVSRLQDEFGEGMVIEDDEARRLMTETALKTCQETLAQLIVKQERSFKETKMETTRVKAIKEKLEGLMREFHYDQVTRKEPKARKNAKQVLNVKNMEEDAERMTQQRHELQLLHDQIKEQFEAGSNSSISVTEMAEKIDELVNKVISLETSVSSQDALITRMRTETDQLQSQIHTLEDDKSSLINEKTDLSNQLREMDEKMHEIQDLEEMVETQNSNLQTFFNEARCNLDHLCEEVQNVKPDVEDEFMDFSNRESKSSGEALTKHGVVGQATLNQDHFLLPDAKSIKKHKDLDLMDNDAQIENQISVTGLVDNDVQKDKEIKVISTQNSDVQKDKEIKVIRMQEKEKVLLTEYTNTLRNYKDVKKKLSEIEKKAQDDLFDTSLKLKELKTSNAMKDEEIKLLRRKLGLMEKNMEGNEASAESRAIEELAEEEENEEIFKIDQSDTTSAIEEKFRRNIDEILEENLGFWIKFSTTFTEIQKFETTIRDLQTDVAKLEEKGKSESVKQSAKSDARPIFKHLVEIQNELSVWLDKGASLKEELQSRSSSLCEIQEEITMALKASAEDYDFKFTSYQAAKFQGEVLNMKQENNKVADELQAGLEHVENLQLDIEKDLGKLGEQFGFSNPNRPQTSQIRHSDSSRSRVPLGAFIFGVKPKKQKHSIFSSITPGMHRKYRALRGHGNM
ncbi:protein NETWORKED 2D-like [Senna tora]|uniref:Protein NETWORKED 2D-like n=1 Tax=Senna tora TaxID=362788 RepID=A0A834WRG3_9FABA|nr:protein NETWORKED 2D-like [Senna tora]